MVQVVNQTVGHQIMVIQVIQFVILMILMLFGLVMRMVFGSLLHMKADLSNLKCKILNVMVLQVELCRWEFGVIQVLAIQIKKPFMVVLLPMVIIQQRYLIYLQVIIIYLRMVLLAMNVIGNLQEQEFQSLNVVVALLVIHRLLMMNVLRLLVQEHCQTHWDCQVAMEVAIHSKGISYQIMEQIFVRQQAILILLFQTAQMGRKQSLQEMFGILLWQRVLFYKHKLVQQVQA